MVKRPIKRIDLTSSDHSLLTSSYDGPGKAWPIPTLLANLLFKADSQH